MVGPALQQPDSHHLIHEMAWQEANTIQSVIERLWQTNAVEQFVEATGIFIEVVESRILSHAIEEERGLYPSWLAMNNAWTAMVASFIENHDHLRRLIHRLKDITMQAYYPEVLPLIAEFLKQSHAHSDREETFMGWIMGTEKSDSL